MPIGDPLNNALTVIEEFRWFARHAEPSHYLGHARYPSVDVKSEEFCNFLRVVVLARQSAAAASGVTARSSAADGAARPVMSR